MNTFTLPSLDDLKHLFKLRRYWGLKRFKRLYFALLNHLGSNEFAKVVHTPHGKKNQKWLSEIASSFEERVDHSKVETNYSDSPRFRITKSGVKSFELELRPLGNPCVANSRDFAIVTRGKSDSSSQYNWALQAMVATLHELGLVFLEDEPNYATLLTNSDSWSVECMSRNTIEIRPTLACNHYCGFCNSPSNGAAANHIRLKEFEKTLDSLETLRLTTICISGGEPTLLKELPELIEMCSLRGYDSELQTNGMAFDDFEYGIKLRRSGLRKLFVSLHSARPEVSDKRITLCDGGWERTVQGIDNAVKIGFQVQLNHVIHTANQSETQDFLEFVNQRWGSYVSTVISFVAPTGRAGENVADMIPDMSHSKRVLKGALAFAKTNRQDVIMTGNCGMPPCLLGEHSDLSTVSQRKEKFNKDIHHIKLDPCDDCSNNDYCPGLWLGYFNKWGDPGLKTMRQHPLPAHRRDLRSPRRGTQARPPAWRHRDRRTSDIGVSGLCAQHRRRRG